MDYLAKQRGKLYLLRDILETRISAFAAEMTAFHTKLGEIAAKSKQKSAKIRADNARINQAIDAIVASGGDETAIANAERLYKELNGTR